MARPTHANHDFLNHVLDQLQSWAPVHAKAMFGGHGLYRDGLMFALIARDRLYLKADPLSLAAFEAHGLAPFTYESGGRQVALSYRQAPEVVLEDPLQMAHWAAMAYASACRSQSTRTVRAVRQRTPARAELAPGQDVGFFEMLNLGDKSRQMLLDAGVKSVAELQALGAVRAFVRVRQVCPRASLNLLWALEGALSGRHWQVVARDDRASLLMALEDALRTP